jgi:YidC/Oxa1 family membrane protein insertase
VVTDLWNLAIVNPMMNILVFIYSLVGNYGVAIIILTILLKLVTLPFSLQQTKSMKKQAEVAPELQALQKKYAKDKEKLSQEQMKLYKERGINPLGGCLPMLIPWPLFVAFYQSVNTVMSTQPEQFLELSKHLLPALAPVVPVGVQFLWLNLTKPDPLYILPALAVITTWLQQKMMAGMQAGGDGQAQSMNQTMSFMMPLFMGYITLSFASGLAIYWVLFNIIAIIQQYFIAGWGDLGKMLPPWFLKIFPGPKLAVATVAVSSTNSSKNDTAKSTGGKSMTSTASSSKSGVATANKASQNGPRKPSRDRRATILDDDAYAGTVSTRRRSAVVDPEPDAAVAGDAQSATALPAKKSRRKKNPEQ